MSNALFSDLSEVSSQEISGGADLNSKNPSTVYGVPGTNYGQRKKSNPLVADADGNPSVVYLTLSGPTNYGLAKP